MNRVRCFTFLAAALVCATPAFATTITGGFSISGYLDDESITNTGGVVCFDVTSGGCKNPIMPGLGEKVSSPNAEGSGTFAAITPGLPLDFSSTLVLDLLFLDLPQQLFDFTFNGVTYTFTATSYDDGDPVEIAGVMTDTNGDSGYGMFDFTSPSGGRGNFSSTYTATDSLINLVDGRAPEPTGFALLGTGMAAVVTQLRRRRIS